MNENRERSSDMNGSSRLLRVRFLPNEEFKFLPSVSLCLRGENRHPKCRRCSFRMHRSITTKMPAWRAFSAAASWTTPSCIQIAGTFSLNCLLDDLRHKFGAAEDVDDVDLLRHILQRRVGLLAQRLGDRAD